jgi:chromosome segregation ATPase
VNTAVVDPERVDEAFSDLWLRVGYHMVGALGHRFDDDVRTTQQRLARVEQSQVVLAERVDGLTVRLDKVELRLDTVEQRLDKVEQRLDKVEQRLDKVEQRLDKVEQRLDKVEQRLDKVEQRLEKLEHGQRELSDRVGRLEISMLRGFDRIEASLDVLRGLVLRSEQPTAPPAPRPGE